MITLNTVFTQTIQDPKGNNVTDINEGLRNYYPQIIYSTTHNTEKITPFLVDDIMAHQPDLVAYNIYSSVNYWFWLLITNYLDDPFEGIKSAWMYSSYPESVADDAQTTSLSTSEDSRYGSVVTLN